MSLGIEEAHPLNATPSPGNPALFRGWVEQPLLSLKKALVPGG